MKKGICMLLIASMMICLCACGSKESKAPSDEVGVAKVENSSDGIIVEKPVQEETEAEDVVTYANADTNSADENSGDQAQTGNSVLAAFAGEYKNSDGDSFLIEQDNGTGEYKISMVKLYSAEGWPEDTDSDGVRFYDTPTIESITGDPNDMIIVETISQYTAGNGTFMIGVNGAADVKYRGYSSTAELNGNYYSYFTK